jgi:hypothetical protein
MIQSIVVSPYPMIQYLWLTVALPKSCKIKEICGSQVSKRMASENWP